MSHTPTEKKSHWLDVVFRDRVFLPGTEGVIVPSGQTFQRPASPCEGTIRYNTSLNAFEGYANSVWLQFPIGSVVGEANTASNLGGGIGVFNSKVALDLQFKSLVAGTNITLIDNVTEILISAPTAGESNTASNIGGGAGWFDNKVGVDLRFKSLISNVPGTLTITENVTDITLDLVGAPYLPLSGGVMSGNIGFSGTARLLADSTNTATNPSYSFGADTDTGMFSLSPDQIGFSSAGSTILFNRTNGVWAVGAPSYASLLSNDADIPNKKYVDDLITAIPDHVEVAGDTMTGTLSMTGAAQIFGTIAGTAVAPSYAFDTMGSTGFFPTGGNSIGISTTGAHRWTITGGGAGGDILPSIPSQYDIGAVGSEVDNVFSNTFQASNGTAPAPSFSFISDPSTGIYLSGSNLAFSTGGVNRWFIGATGTFIPFSPNTLDIGSTGSRVAIVHTNRVSADLSSAILPSYYFGLDSNTGLWSPAGDTIGFATAGADRMQIQPNGLIHAETAVYETLVIAGDDNSIPNKKYVDDSIPTVLNDLGDVTITTPVIDSYIQYNGAGQWVNIPRILRINDADDDSYVNVDFGGSDSDTVRIQAGSNPSANAGTINIETLAAVTPGYTGGTISVIAGDGIDAKGGDVSIASGDGTYSSAGGNGGDLSISAGEGYGPLGATTYRGGDINLNAGNGIGGDTTGGTVKIVAGNGRGGFNSGGDVEIEAGDHTGSAVGSIILKTGAPTGGGTPGSVNLVSKATASEATAVRFGEALGGSDYIGLKAPDSVTTSRTWVLPSDDPASVAGDFLTTDASGNLSFAPSSSTYRQSFINSSLVGNILTVTHNLGQKYVQVIVWSDLDRVMLPDIITAVNTNTLTLDLSSFVPLPGTWNIVVTA